jgi:hypothetical protein
LVGSGAQAVTGTVFPVESHEILHLTRGIRDCGEGPL